MYIHNLKFYHIPKIAVRDEQPCRAEIVGKARRKAESGTRQSTHPKGKNGVKFGTVGLTLYDEFPSQDPAWVGLEMASIPP